MLSDATTAFVGFGANLVVPDEVALSASDWRDASERATRIAQTLAMALQRMASLPGTTLTAVSSLYRSAPVDATGPDYYNGVAELATQLEPLDLLDAVQAIEHEFGRTRPFRNAPRVLDLDLLMYGDLQIDTVRLQIPHPRAAARAFVLRPLAELQPDLAIPGFGPLAPLLARINDQSIEQVGPIDVILGP